MSARAGVEASRQLALCRSFERLGGAGKSPMRRVKVGLVALAALAVLLPSEASRAQEAYPTRLVRIVVPYPAGGGTYTLLLASPGPIATNAFLYKEMGYDPARWVPIALLATGPYVLVLRKNFEGSTVADLIARAKSNPGKITSATPGVGSVGHLSTVQLEMLAGIKTAQIPYRGLSQALNDLIAEHVDMMFDTPTTSLALHRDGKVKIVAVGTTERVRELPEVPTVAESGLPGYRAVTWYAMVAPPQTPAVLADKINRDVIEIFARPDVAEKTRGIQMEPVTKSRREAAQFFVEEAQLWGKVIRQADIPLQ